MVVTKRTVINGDFPFDLCIGKVLEHWTVSFAVREVIANASTSRSSAARRTRPSPKTRTGSWHVADSGRGLRYE